MLFSGFDISSRVAEAAARLLESYEFSALVDFF